MENTILGEILLAHTASYHIKSTTNKTINLWLIKPLAGESVVLDVHFHEVSMLCTLESDWGQQ